MAGTPPSARSAYLSSVTGPLSRGRGARGSWRRRPGRRSGRAPRSSPWASAAGGQRLAQPLGAERVAVGALVEDAGGHHVGGLGAGGAAGGRGVGADGGGLRADAGGEPPPARSPGVPGA